MSTIWRRHNITGGDNYIGNIKTLFGSNLIQYLPLNEGPAGNAYLTFNGTSTKVDCGSGASLDDVPGGGEFTADGWFYPLTTGESNQGRLLAKTNNSSNGWQVKQNASTTLTAWLYSGGVRREVLSTTQLSLNSWHHVAITWNDTTQTLGLSVDGDLTTTTFAGAYNSDAAENLIIGSLASDTREFDGYIGWVRISDSVRWTADFTGSIPSRTTIPTVDANTVSLWPMNEGYGSVAGDIGTNDNDGTISNGDWGSYPTADDKSLQANDGAYTGVVLGNGALPSKIGGYAPYFDGVNDYVDVYSAALNSDFNGQLGSFLIWAKVPASVWTDGTNRTIGVYRVDGSNMLNFRVVVTNNTVDWRYIAGGTTKTITKGGLSTTDWFHMAMTWTLAGDEVKMFWNGAQEGATQTGLGTWAGNLASDTCNIGTFTTSPTGSCVGWFGHGVLLDRVATPAEILQVYNFGV